MDFHLGQAQRNYEVFTLLRRSGYEDWAATTLFYAALQCVEAWLERRQLDPRTHQQRQALLRRLQVPRVVFAAFVSLEEHSRLARYEDWRPFLTADLLATLYSRDYALVCAFFEAPEQIRPPATPRFTGD